MAKITKEENRYLFEKVLRASDRKGVEHDVAIIRSRDGRVLYINTLGPTGLKWLDSLPDYQPTSSDDDIEF